MKIKLTIIYSILTIISFLIFDFLMESKQKEIDNILKKSSLITKNSFSSVLNTYEVVAKKDYNSLISNEEAMNILKRFKYTINDDEKAILRGRLYRLYAKEYEYLKTLNVRQFHFHTHEGKSLLRMHMPHLSGDSLIDIRPSIKIANTEFRNVHKFEGGRIFPGFRYLFPIIYKNEHLGSVEYSISFDAVDKMLNSILKYHAKQLHLHGRISYEKVFSSYKSYFNESDFKNNHYVENTTLTKNFDKLKKDSITQKINAIILKNDEFNKKFNDYQDFSMSIIDKNESYIVSFLSIKDTTDKHAAYLVTYAKNNIFIQINEKYNSFYILSFIAAFLIYLLVYFIVHQVSKTLKHKNLLAVSNENMQNLLDLQSSIVILTDGKTIKFSNRKFYAFFGFNSLKSYLENYNCIYENFIFNEKVYKKELLSNNKWLENLLVLPKSERIVSMKSYNDMVYIFSVNISSHSKNGLYIVSFTDITETIKEQRKLNLKVIKDKLTGAFNREYFEQNYKRLIQKVKSENKFLAFSMVDIDHFKFVNDTYGHDIGDDVLKDVVKLINKTTRTNDVLIRWGGEEFVLILILENKDHLKNALNSTRKAISKHNFKVLDKPCTCSFGATFYEDDECIDETLKRADIALYEAKNTGRNKVCINLL